MTPGNGGFDWGLTGDPVLFHRKVDHTNTNGRSERETKRKGREEEVGRVI